MADMTITVDPDELLGLIAVAELGQVAKSDGGEADAESKEADAESEAALRELAALSQDMGLGT